MWPSQLLRLLRLLRLQIRSLLELERLTPGQNQQVTVPDSGQSSTHVILQDNGSQQNVNSNLQVANNVKFTPTSTFITNGLLQIQPDGNSKSVLRLLGWGPGANALEFNANNQASMSAPTGPNQYLTVQRCHSVVIWSDKWLLVVRKGIWQRRSC
jgi:hypothetical protein